jgi:hypothetical protein
VHFLPAHNNYLFTDHATQRAYLAADVDISWLHDFSPRIGYEVGIKLGIAGRVTGDSDSYPHGVMFSKDLYPLINVFSGFRF